MNHGIELFNTLQKRGVPSKLVYFPDENHWVLKPQNSLFWYQTVRDWVATYAQAGRVLVEEMRMKRRTLLSLAAAGARRRWRCPPWAAKKPKPLKILILGGTRFIGLHMTALALERGHTLTYFNRGKTKTDRYPRSRAHQGRSQRRDRRAQGSRMGRGHRQLGLRAAPCAARRRSCWRRR